MKSLDWQLLHSVHRLQDRWISVRADTCRMPDGRLVEPFYILEYADWVNVVAITKQQEVVLVRQYRHGLQRSTIELPGGGIDGKDLSPVTAAKRELLEETGYTSDLFVQTGVVSANPANHTNLTYSFLAIDVEPVSAVSFDEGEEIEIVLTPLNRVQEMLARGEFIHALHISSLFYALQQLGRFDLKR